MKRYISENPTAIDEGKEADLYEVFGEILKELLEILTDRECKVLCLFYGIYGMKKITIKEIAREFNVKQDRIVAIKKRALRKLQRPSRLVKISRYVNQGLDIKDILVGYSKHTLELKAPAEEDYDEADDTLDINMQPIERLKLSIRTYNILKRMGVNTIGDLCCLTWEKLMGFKGLGYKSRADLYDKIIEYGLELGQEKKNVKRDISKQPIELLKLSPCCYNSLKNKGIDIVRDISLRSRSELIKYFDSVKEYAELQEIITEKGITLREKGVGTKGFSYSSKVKEIYQDQEKGWEYRLYAELMITNYEWLSEYRRSVQLLEGNSYEDIQMRCLDDLEDYLIEFLQYMKNYAEEIAVVQKKTREVLEEKKDADVSISAIESVVDNLLAIYRKWINEGRRMLVIQTKIDSIDCWDHNDFFKELISRMMSGIFAVIDDLYYVLCTARYRYDYYSYKMKAFYEFKSFLNMSVCGYTEEIQGSLHELFESIRSEKNTNNIV